MLKLGLRLRGLSPYISSRYQRFSNEFRPERLDTRLHAPRVSAINSVSADANKNLSCTALPISEREFCEEVPSHAILAWYRGAKLETTALATKLTESDDPTFEDLLVSHVHWMQFHVIGCGGGRGPRGGGERGWKGE